ncbi:MAG: hypothetical protein ABI741_05310 [Ferruginibacter sp.]
MKIIVSHDVDHLFWSEHLLKDLYITKLWLRSFKLLLTGVIDAKTFAARINFWTDKRINRLDELMEYESLMNIPATYFFVMRKGFGVSYSVEKAKPFIKEILGKGFNVGVHGMSYKDPEAMKKEFESFKNISGLDSFGVRMHYLRNDPDTIKYLSRTGYSFDSTDYKIEAPYPVNKMIEFPIAVMDAYAVRPAHKKIDIAKAYTLERLALAEKNNVPYFTINFHDLVFNPAYSLYKDWFTWLIEHCIHKNYHFINFENAIKEQHENKTNDGR